MTTFEDLKTHWQNQPEQETPKGGSKQIIDKLNFIKKKQQITSVVLSVTAIVLTVFFFYVMAYKNTTAFFALLLMISSLFIRISIEFFSINKLKQINITVTHASFKSQVINYYKKRIKIHYIITPVLFSLYIIGFVMLLPFFKAGVSSWFYTYILVSGAVFLIIIAMYVKKQIQKELRLIKNIQK